MLRLTPKYGPDGLNWSCFPYDEWILGDSLECPGCGAPMGGLQGKVEVQNPIGEDGRPGKAIVLPLNYANDAHVCPECGKVCKTPLALNGHMRSHMKATDTEAKGA